MERKVATPAGIASKPRPWTEHSKGSSSVLARGKRNLERNVARIYALKVYEARDSASYGGKWKPVCIFFNEIPTILMERKVATPAGIASKPRPWAEHSKGSGSVLARGKRNLERSVASIHT